MDCNDHKPIIPELEWLNITESELTDRQRKIIDHFTRIYVDLNAHAARTQRDSETAKALLSERDQLEDSVAPYGILVEPYYEAHIARRLEITIGRLDPEAHRPQYWRSTTAAIFIDPESPSSATPT